MKQTTRIKCQRDHLNVARQLKWREKKKHVCNSVLSRCSSGENELVFRKHSQKLDTNESYEIESIPKLKKARPNSKTTDFAFFFCHFIELTDEKKKRKYIREWKRERENEKQNSKWVEVQICSTWNNVEIDFAHFTVRERRYRISNSASNVISNAIVVTYTLNRNLLNDSSWFRSHILASMRNSPQK